MLQDTWFDMQRCPYIHEMKERLLGEQMALVQEHNPQPIINRSPEPVTITMPVHQQHHYQQQQPVGTVVRVGFFYL